MEREERERRRPEPPAPAPPAPTTNADVAGLILAAQRTAGNQAVARVIQQRTGGPTLQRAPGLWGQVTKFLTGTYTVTIGSEQVRVKDEKEEAEAAQIIADIKDVYGIEISSLKSIEAIKKHYDKPAQSVRDSLAADTWEFRELVALKRALAHFAPILGERRKHSTRKGDDQEVTSAGKVEESIDVNTATGALDPNTLGEFFKESKNFTMFEPGETSTVDFPGDNAKQLEATAVHEIAHGLMKYMINDFIAATGYWTDETTKSGKAGAEAPPTPYGDKNAREDLSESVMLYFVDAKRLLDGNGAAAGSPGNACPQRHAAIEKAVNAWTAQMGDFPMPDPNATTAMA